MCALVFFTKLRRISTKKIMSIKIFSMKNKNVIRLKQHKKKDFALKKKRKHKKH